MPDSEFGSEDPLLEYASSKTQPQWAARNRIRAMVYIGIGCILYSVVLVLITSRVLETQRRYGTRWIDSPANDFIAYESRVFSVDEAIKQDGYFSSTPSPRVDQNWHELFQDQDIALSPEIMRNLGREDQGIKLPDGNYFGAMMVFHHLHCLKNIYHTLHPEYYTYVIQKTPEGRATQEFHTRHCLHLLKEAVMCQADPTFITMKWSEHAPIPIGNLSSPHECVNWDRLQEWVVPHSFDPLEDGVLVHPKYGPAFKDRDWVDFKKTYQVDKSTE